MDNVPFARIEFENGAIIVSVGEPEPESFPDTADGLNRALDYARSVLIDSVGPIRPDRWPTSAEIAPRVAADPVRETRAARETRKNPAADPRRKARRPRRRRKSVRKPRTTNRPVALPADRSKKPDCAPAGFVWRVSRPDGSFLAENASRARARETSGGNQHLAGHAIRLRARLVQSKAYRAGFKESAVRAKRTKIERSSKVRRQRGQNETRVLRAAANRR